MTTRRPLFLLLSLLLAFPLLGLMRGLPVLAESFDCPSDLEIDMKIEDCEREGMEALVKFDEEQCTYVHCVHPDRIDCPSWDEITEMKRLCKDREMDYEYWEDENGCGHVECIDRKDKCPNEDDILEMKERCRKAGMEYKYWSDDRGCEHVECREDDDRDDRKCISPEELDYQARKCEEEDREVIYKKDGNCEWVKCKGKGRKCHLPEDDVHRMAEECERRGGEPKKWMDDHQCWRFKCKGEGERIHELCKELKEELHDMDPYDSEYDELRKKFAEHCLERAPDRCRELKEKLARHVSANDTSSAEYDRVKREYIELCDPTRSLDCDDLRRMFGHAKDQGNEDLAEEIAEYLHDRCDRPEKEKCEELREKLAGKRKDDPSFKKHWKEFHKICLPNKPQDHCKELKHVMKRCIKDVGEFDEKCERAKEAYRDLCMKPDDNLCDDLEARADSIASPVYDRLCEDGKPRFPDRDIFCPKMREALEEGSNYTAEEKRLYYEICHRESNYRPENVTCKDIRKKLVDILNDSGAADEDYLRLNDEFMSKCQERGVVPPAGFEEEVLTVDDCTAYDNPFPDTAACDEEGTAARELYRRGVIGGFPDGEFKGDRPVNRAEAAKFLLLACNRDTEAVYSGNLKDILGNQWYTPFVEAAYRQGIISGYPDGTFRPASTVNRAEFLKMLNRACGVEESLPYTYEDVSGSDWFSVFAGAAQLYDLYPDSIDGYLKPGQLLSRNEVAEAIYNYLLHRP